MPDSSGPRFCINLCSVAGNYVPAGASASNNDNSGVSSDDSGGGESDSESGVVAAWPLLHKLAAAGLWSGCMHYASGEQGMSPAPFVLDGTTEGATRACAPRIFERSGCNACCSHQAASGDHWQRVAARSSGCLQ